MSHADSYQAISIESEERFGKNLISPTVEQPGTNIFVESQLPGFVREDHPRFVSFLEAYYKWLDENDNIGEKIRKIRQQQDIDEAKDEFVEQFFKEFLVNIPRYVLTNKKVLLKYIRQFYRSKGTEKSYKLFFRMLYDTNVDFYYPSRDIFKTSDGKWVQRKIIRVFSSNGTLEDFHNKKIIGIQNGVVAFVDEVREIIVDGYIFYELVLNTSSISGTLLPNETIKTEDGLFFARISPIPTTYKFAYDSMLNKKTGRGYKVGDTFKILNQNGKGGRIKVTSIVPTKRVETEIVLTPVGDANAVSSINLGKKNLLGIVSVICANDQGRYQIEPKSKPQTDPDGTRHEPVRSFYDVKSEVDGSIKLILKESFTAPSGRVRVEYQHLVEDTTGEVENLQIVNFGIEYNKYDNSTLRTFNIQLNRQSCVSENFTGDENVELTITSNAVGTYPGFYSNEDGHLSTSKYIQDGEYYQQYSYVTLVDQPTGDYRESLKKLVHPIGFKFFGKFRPQNHMNMKSALAPKSKYSNVRREFKQFHRPDVGKNPPLLATPKCRTFLSLVKQTNRERSSYGLGPSNNSIFRERFNYKPTEKFYSTQEVNTHNADYWGNPNTLSSQLANTSIDKFIHMIPIVVEGITQATRKTLVSVQDKQKMLMKPTRCDMIHNSTFNIVEMYDGQRWVEIAPNSRINMLPDSVVTTTNLIISETGDLELKLTSVRSIETLGKPKVGLL